jgi:4-amino-4-deoxy-L-arabinose transferase-like glycosyltransferase
MKVVRSIGNVVSSRPGLTIFILAFVARLAWILVMKWGTSWADEVDYLAIARHLAAGDGYISESHRTLPVLPFYLSLVFRVFGESLLIARVGQAVFGALTCVLLCRIGSRLFSPTAGLFSGLILAIYPPHIYLAGVFYAECLATFLCTLSVYLAIRAVEPGAPRLFGLLTGVVLGLTALTRSIFAVVVPCVCIAWLCEAPSEWRKRLGCCVLLIVGASATISPWTIRNYVVYGRLIPLSTGFYQQLWWGNNELATGSAADRFLFVGEPFWMERLKQFDEQRQKEITEKYAAITDLIAERTRRYGDAAIAADEVLQPVVMSYIASHPTLTIFRSAKKLCAMFFVAFGDTLTKNAYTTRLYKWLAAASYYPVLALALVGVYLSLSRRRQFTIVYLLVGCVAIVQSIMTVNTRYRLPLDPYLILFASVTLACVLSKRFLGQTSNGRCDSGPLASARRV